MLTRRKNKWRALTPYIMIAPFLISFILFFALPSLLAFVLSFFKYKGYGDAVFIGLKNYVNLLTYEMFWTAVKNTLFYYVLHIAPVIILSFLTAVAMHSKFLKKWGKFYKPILFLPQIMPIVAASLVFKILLATRYGPINEMLGTQIPFLESTSIMRFSVVLVEIWRGFGWFLVIFAAGLTTVNSDLLEAAKIDGANAVQTTTRVIIPLMKPVFLFAFIMDSITSFKIYIEPNILLSGSSGLGAPPGGMPMLNIVTQNMSSGSFGMASAAGWVIFVITFIAYLLINFLIKDKE